MENNNTCKSSLQLYHHLRCKHDNLISKKRKSLVASFPPFLVKDSKRLKSLFIEVLHCDEPEGSELCPNLNKRIEVWPQWKWWGYTGSLEPTQQGMRSPRLVSLHWFPVKFIVEFKILVLTYKDIHGQSPSYLEQLIVSYHPSRTWRSQDAGYWWSQESPTVEWEVELSAIKVHSCGTIFQCWYGRQTHSLILRVGLKPSFLLKLIVTAGLSGP